MKSVLPTRNNRLFFQKVARCCFGRSKRNCSSSLKRQVPQEQQRRRQAGLSIQDAINRTRHQKKHWGMIFAGVAVGTGLMQVAYGSADDFYDHRFVTDKDPDDLASFYGGEEFMQLFTIFPFVERIMMRGAYFDDEGVAHAPGLPGEMVVSMDFLDGEEADGTTAWFNKREIFSNQFLGHVLFETCSSFGFHKLSDGTLEVYHHGEYFQGPWYLRLVFVLHAKYVAWATEHHIKNYAFTASTELEEMEEEESRRNMIVHFVRKNYLDSLSLRVEAKIASRKTARKDTKELEQTLLELRNLQEKERERTITNVRRRDTRVGNEQVLAHFNFSDDPEAQKIIQKATHK